MAEAARILIIEDDPTFRKMARLALVTAGYSVQEAADGRAGLASYLQQPPDLVITDIVMPEQDGIETIQAVLEHDPKARVIAMSGANPERVVHYLHAAEKFGARRILRKPFAVDQLLAAVSQVLAT
jgi:CheY-like chemotaxis protein